MNLEQEVERLQTQVMMLKRDLDKKHRECAERERQCLMLAEDNECLHDELTRIKSIIAGFLENEEAIDGGNL